MRMRPVYSVKVADTDQRRPEVSGNIVEFVEYVHGNSDQWLVVSDQQNRLSAGSLTTDHWPLISNSSFIPSYDSRTCRGKVAFVASCARSWQICVKKARFGFTRSTMASEPFTVECVGCGLCRSASRKRMSSPSSWR